MREKNRRFITAGIIAAMAVLSVQSEAALLVYDGFDSAATADAANGIYANDWLTNGVNPSVAGGNMVGIQASDTWTAQMDYRIDDGKIGLKDSWVASRNASRAITANMTGKTVAWASAVVSAYLPDYGNASYAPLAVVGFSDSNFGSAAGAGLGFRWNHNTEQWDISTRHLNGGWAYGTVQASVGTDTGEFYLLWKMDDAANELSVWVNPTDTNVAPTAVFDFEGQVGNITHMNLLTYRLNDSLLDGINMFTVDELRLGDTMEDVFIDYTPGLLAFEGFDTAATADASNGIYQTAVSFTNAANANVAGGNMIGFQSSDAWSPGTKTCNYLMPVDGKGGAKIILNDGEQHATRAIAEDLTGKTVLWQSATMGIDFDYGAAGTNAIYNPIAVAGYGGYDVLYRVGAYLGFRWDGTNWDLVARYKNTAGTPVWQTVKEDLGTTVADTFLIWKMDDANDELSIWIDITDTNHAPDVVLSDYANTVGNIANINIYTYRLGRRVDGHPFFSVDDMKLGETMQSVMPKRVVGYSGWAETWGVDIGASTNDYDGDGLINLHEYGLDGDPTNALDRGTSPVLDIESVGGTNRMTYVYPQRSASDSGLSYYLELNTDLVAGTWTNSGYAVTGTNDTGGAMDFVTNVTGMVEGEKFIRLIIIEE